jgi:low affinity Fe/Cu permease
VIQNSANRDAKAIHLKLDEIIRATKGARNELITLERAPEAVVAKTAEELAEVAEKQKGPGVATVRVTETVNGQTETATAVAEPSRPIAGPRTKPQPRGSKQS